MRFAGRHVLVTGGSSGIGRATCERLAAEGARVAVLSRDGAAAGDVAQRIGGIAIPADLAEETAIQDAAARIAKEWGTLDFLVSNAATMTFTPILETEAADFDRVIAVNLRAPFLLLRYLGGMIRRGGAVVHVSSVHAAATTANVAPYAASKGGLEALTRAASIEFTPRGVRVNAVAPGAVETPMLRANPNIASGVEKLEGPVGRPEQIAAAICFLLSEEAGFATGAVLSVDGGRLAAL
ncbi:SDR family NAD(P)-dependent oxidoreductase [Sabulicella rubraurantiaca]|uniref:SDR family NAD(P)-dependent oxidoreductase n=1 Tax=Sabulicella rubraurantiaca TaxID=2811429 RepID=UPI001A969057|nr:SDR family NAD(P)-dependent oxidoreductase [Sabulicella rubraurantiaca]